MDSDRLNEHGYDFHVVGIGASAGGLEALEHFFQGVPQDSGAAYVIIQHLSADFESILDEIIRRRANIPVQHAVEGDQLKPDHAYVLPPGKEMIIADGRLRLTEKSTDESFALPIDHFFRSLGQEVERRAVAIILSGTGRDGSRGILDVHETGGMVIAQAPETAAFETMPSHAIETGLVDRILAPADMPKALLQHFSSRPHSSDSQANDQFATFSDFKDDCMNGLFRLLRSRYGMDFTYYKPSMIMRRIERRLTMGDTVNLEDYVQRLGEDEDELDALYHDLLIGVTSFFRDPDAWQHLRNDLLPGLIDNSAPDEEFRVWVAATATGEEAYSLAILLFELFEERDRPPNFRIFATDVHSTSLATAGSAVYPPSVSVTYHLSVGDGSSDRKWMACMSIRNCGKLLSSHSTTPSAMHRSRIWIWSPAGTCSSI